MHDLIVRLRRFLLRRSYLRLHRNGTPKKNHILLLSQYCKLVKKLSLEQHTYRQLVKYRLAVKTDNLEVLLVAIDHLVDLIKLNSYAVEHKSEQFNRRVVRRLDEWIVSNQNIYYDSDRAVVLLTERIEILLRTFSDLKKNDDAMYSYYMSAIESYFIECQIALDALIALQLNIPNSERHYKT